MNRKIGLILVIINLIMAAMAAHFFLNTQKLSVVQWLMVNTCTPSIILFAAGYFFRSMWLMGFSATWMLFYGGGGLVVFQWSADPQHLMPQVGHIFMVAAVIYVVVTAIAGKKFMKFCLGFLFGILFLIPTLYLQNRYQKNHPELVKLLGFKENYRPHQYNQR